MKLLTAVKLPKHAILQRNNYGLPYCNSTYPDQGRIGTGSGEKSSLFLRPAVAVQGSGDAATKLLCGTNSR